MWPFTFINEPSETLPCSETVYTHSNKIKKTRFAELTYQNKCNKENHNCDQQHMIHATKCMSYEVTQL